MNKFFTISQTAKIGNVTAETLRHYDRIGLLSPCETDRWTGYRYYSEKEIVRLNTICALKCMDLSLSEIKEILQVNDFEKIISFLKLAEQNAENKISELKDSQSKIQRARHFYESKLSGSQPQEIFTKNIQKRVILLSEHLQAPSIENLWNYHRHFYNQLSDINKDDFSFEDLAGIYESEGQSRLFTVCTRYKEIKNMKILPEGEYLCADCTEKNREEVLRNLYETAKREYSTIPEFTIQIIVLSGILQWNYQIQMFIDPN